MNSKTQQSAVNITDDNKFKTLIFSQLKKLSFGNLTIIDDCGEYVFGQGTSSEHKKSNNESLQVTLYIHDQSVYKQLLFSGSIGAADAYIDKKWDCDNLTGLMQIFAINQKVLDQLERKFALLGFIKNKISHLINRNSKSGSKRNILSHYDLGNRLYETFLDEKMQYSSGIFSSTDLPHDSLDEAQIIKLDKICTQLELTPDDHLIEIGTGWGGLAIHAATQYGCKVTTTTISDAQHAYVESKIKALELGDQITLLKKDYRDLSGSFTKLVSVEMIEAVGHNYLSSFFSKCNELVQPRGKILIQAITIADQRYDYYRKSVDFIQTHVFPGGCLPSLTVMLNMMTKHTDFITQSIFDFGHDYAKTLECWSQRFNANIHQIADDHYNERFVRLWNFYLSYCRGGFLEKQISVVHLLGQKL